jgi:circadian clock protein KaiC
VIIDPISNLISVGVSSDVKSMLTRLIDYLKNKQITAMFTNLSHSDMIEQTAAEISSLMDTWILLRDIEIGGERNRGLYVLKSRGMAHSNQIREFVLTGHGIDLLDVYTGPEGVLTGSARLTMEARERSEAAQRSEERERIQREIERKKRLFDLKVEEMRSDFESEEEMLRQRMAEGDKREIVLAENRERMAHLRRSDEAKESEGKREG